ncbi:alkaline phosphatase PhoX [Paraflavisolibacter sp. H34]|uniref:alkaline phosphatase PhoX n=1 Tax=Huijunlia imazamoxiresistens TaxID=3127457 RepID=UPI003018A364
MNKKFATPLVLCTLGATLALAYACRKNDDAPSTAAGSALPQVRNYSATPALLKKLSGFEGLELFTLISSEDSLPNFRFGGSADGAGFIKAQNDSGFIMMVNNEDNYAVSKLYLDKNLKPFKGEYALNSDGGQWRLCSGTMATPARHGFGPMYLSVGESSAEAMVHALDPYASFSTPSTPRGLPGLGRWSGENAVPLYKEAYPGKTVILTGEDASDASGGQVALYLSHSVGNLDNGTQYMMKRVDGNTKETDMAAGTAYDVEFVKVDNHKTITGAQMQALAAPLQAIKFGRVEDIDTRKGSAANYREIYFNVTGQDPVGVNADRSRTVMGRVYKLVLDASNPLKGKLTCILDGDNDNGPARDFQNPDNLCVTTNYVYIQEDSNTYGSEDHDAYIYQYNIATGELKKVLELDHRRTAPDAAKYNVGGTSAKGSWEYGALLDVSEETGLENTFVLCVQPHSWTDARFAGVDGGSKRLTEKQGSEIVLIKGLPR